MTQQPSSKTHYRLSNGRWRARPGMGKNPWGFTPRQLELQRIRLEFSQRPEQRLQTTFRRVYEFFMGYMAIAREMARENEKDRARRLYFYFPAHDVKELLTNPLLAPYLDLTPEEIEKITEVFQNLQGEVHPLDEPQWMSHVEHIHQMIQELYEALPQKKKRPAKKYRTTQVDAVSGWTSSRYTFPDYYQFVAMYARKR